MQDQNWMIRPLRSFRAGHPRSPMTSVLVSAWIFALVAACSSGPLDSTGSQEQQGAGTGGASALGAGGNTGIGAAGFGVGGGTATSVGGASVDPFAQAPVCTSGQNWTGGENSLMRPGEACIACHSAGEGPRFVVAGTVYPTGHEPNDCNGVSQASQAVVVITDAANNTYQAQVNAAGNFYLQGINLVTPYSAKVVVGSAERAMGSQQTNGDCNSCHSAEGASSAPGRIVLP